MSYVLVGDNGRDLGKIVRHRDLPDGKQELLVILADGRKQMVVEGDQYRLTRISADNMRDLEWCFQMPVYGHKFGDIVAITAGDARGQQGIIIGWDIDESVDVLTLDGRGHCLWVSEVNRLRSSAHDPALFEAALMRYLNRFRRPVYVVEEEVRDARY